MIPVPGLSDVNCAWVEIKSQGFTFHGFLVYRASDKYFPEYLNGEGLNDLDGWTGTDCGVFIVQSPSAKWIDYTRKENHTWWRLFGHLVQGNDELAEVLTETGKTQTHLINGSKMSLQEAFAPCLNEYQHGAEISKILNRFNLKPTDHPCLILFKDLKDKNIWHVDLQDLVDIPERSLRKALQNWFGGREFSKLLKESASA